MKESYYLEGLKAADHDSVVEWVPVVDGVLCLPPDLSQEIARLTEKGSFTGEDRVTRTLRGILEIGKLDMSNPKYLGYFREAADALAESEGELNPWQERYAIREKFAEAGAKAAIRVSKTNIP